MSHKASKPIKRKLTKTSLKNKLHHWPCLTFVTLKWYLKIQFPFFLRLFSEITWTFWWKTRKNISKNNSNYTKLASSPKESLQLTFVVLKWFKNPIINFTFILAKVMIFVRQKRLKKFINCHTRLASPSNKV